jgi:hypothetical protein
MKKLNVERNTWRNLRARLHQLYYKDTPPSDQELAEVRGKIEWVKSLNPCRGEKFFGNLRKNIHETQALFLDPRFYKN